MSVALWSVSYNLIIVPKLLIAWVKKLGTIIILYILVLGESKIFGSQVKKYYLGNHHLYFTLSWIATHLWWHASENMKIVNTLNLSLFV